jgi:hypothetical protein
MHHSRISAYVLDCQVEDLKDAAEFWSRALGRPVTTFDQDGDGKYAELQTNAGEPFLLLQRVDHEARIHLDIETNNLDAEVSRLEALGATRIAFVKRWWVMQAPSGHRFCVVRKQQAELGTQLNASE